MSQKTLTTEYILMRCKAESLSQIKNLNLYGNDLEDIQAVAELTNLEICSLSFNKIKTLQHFQRSLKLKELFLRKNQIADLRELQFLSKLPKLKVLWLQNNPVCQHPLYRQFCIKMIPNLVKLDTDAVTQEERQLSAQTNFTEKDLMPTAQMQ